MTREVCAAPGPSLANGLLAARGRPRVGCAPDLRRSAAVCADSRAGPATRQQVSPIASLHPTIPPGCAEAASTDPAAFILHFLSSDLST